MDLLSRVTISCFGFSYALAWALELARVSFRARIRHGLSIGCVALGLVAHTSFLIFQARIDLGQGTVFGSWHAWGLILAWLLAVASLLVMIRFPKLAYATFLLPLVLASIGVAGRLRSLPSFTPEGTLSIWGFVHGMALLLGTVGVCVGFLAGLMYLLHAEQLKRKRAPWRGLPLPSLERLQRTGERSLVVSSALLAVGLLSGIVLNLLRSDRNRMAIEWSDPVVWTSGVLLAWLLGTLIFQGMYRPARHGRKVAYLVVASFLFLLLELALVVSTSHGTRVDAPNASSDPAGATADDRSAESAAGERQE